MANGPESAQGGETLEVATRFKAFVEARSFPSSSELIGDMRKGYIPIDATTQLIPITSIEYSKFHMMDLNTGDIPESEIGYGISLKDGERDRYSLEYVHGNFIEQDLSGGSYDPIDPAVASQLMDAIERFENPTKQEGN